MLVRHTLTLRNCYEISPVQGWNGWTGISVVLLSELVKRSVIAKEVRSQYLIACFRTEHIVICLCSNSNSGCRKSKNRMEYSLMKAQQK